MTAVKSVHSVDAYAAISGASEVMVMSFVPGIAVSVTKKEARDFLSMFKPNQRWTLGRDGDGLLVLSGQKFMERELKEKDDGECIG